RVETQLMHFDGEDWNAYTFAWRDDQTDADLVPADGNEKEVRLGKETHVWQFHSRSQCLSCHSSWAEYALAFQPEQLNRPGPGGPHPTVRADAGGAHPPGGSRRQRAAALPRPLRRAGA